MQKNTTPNVNEYKMIKNTIEMDEAEELNTKEDSKEIQEIHKDVVNMNIDDDHEKTDEENTDQGKENIEELKASVLNVNDDVEILKNVVANEKHDIHND